MVKIYTVAAPDEWKIRTALERELYQFKFELVPRNYLPNQTYADQLIEKLALADVILVIFTRQLKEKVDLSKVLEFLNANFNKKVVIPISVRNDLHQTDFLEPLNKLVGLEIDPQNQDSLTNAARTIAMAALREKEEKYNEEVAKNINEKSGSYITPTLKSLEKKERNLKNISYLCYFFGLISIIAAAVLVLRFSEEAVNHFSFTAPPNASYIGLIIIRTVSIVIISITASKYCFIIGKSFMNESLKNSNRHHAISFGGFYLQVYKKQIEPNDLKEIFKDWNIEGSSAFAGSSPDEFDPKLVEKVMKVISMVNDNTKKLNK